MKPEYQEYRDDLAKNLKKKRNVGEDGAVTSEGAAEARGYLEAKQETPEYQKNEEIQREIARYVDIPNREVAEHATDWLKECSKDEGESLENFLEIAKKARVQGVSFRIINAAGPLFLMVSVQEPNFYGLQKLDERYQRIADDLRAAVKIFNDNEDYTKLLQLAPQLDDSIKEYTDHKNPIIGKHVSFKRNEDGSYSNRIMLVKFFEDTLGIPSNGDTQKDINKMYEENFEKAEQQRLG